MLCVTPFCLNGIQGFDTPGLGLDLICQVGRMFWFFSQADCWLWQQEYAGWRLYVLDRIFFSKECSLLHGKTTIVSGAYSLNGLKYLHYLIFTLFCGFSLSLNRSRKMGWWAHLMRWVSMISLEVRWSLCLVMGSTGSVIAVKGHESGKYVNMEDCGISPGQVCHIWRESGYLCFG